MVYSQFYASQNWETFGSYGAVHEFGLYKPNSKSNPERD